MAGFLTGPAAQLVGAGMQAVGVGIPVGETSAKVIDGLRNCGLPVPPKTWFKSKDGSKQQQQQPKDERLKKTVYDKLEAHINGMMQVVKPAIELKKLVRDNCCKSAERPRRACSQSPKDNLKYYTPQKCKSGACNLFDDRKSPSAKQTAAKNSSNKNKCGKGRCTKRTSSSSSDDQDHCMYCSRSKSLLELPCGRLICPKCDQSGVHEFQCKQCKAAEKHRVYAY